MHFITPPHTRTQDGSERRAGFELEFAGVGLATIVDIIARLSGGTPQPKGRFEVHIAGAKHGDYNVLMDSRVLHSDKYLEILSYMGIDGSTPKTLHDTEDFLENLAGSVVPYEVVTPPIPLSELEFLNTLVKELRKAGAKGTSDAPWYAFGLHINPEAASLQADWLTAMLQAFVLLEEWIVEEAEVMVTRKITPFIDPFPKDYVAMVLAPGYAPDITGLITDYLDHNPTRNRSLDMLPIFCKLDCDLVHSYPVEHHKMKPRPAFHYRLPDCRIDEPDWTVAQEWNTWVAVEKLAEDDDLRAEMAEDYLKRPHFPGASLITESWPDRVRRWLD